MMKKDDDNERGTTAYPSAVYARVASSPGPVFENDEIHIFAGMGKPTSASSESNFYFIFTSLFSGKIEDRPLSWDSG